MWKFIAFTKSFATYSKYPPKIIGIQQVPRNTVAKQAYQKEGKVFIIIHKMSQMSIYDPNIKSLPKNGIVSGTISYNL